MEKIIVPIVLERAIVEGIVPNGSFIAVDDFDSPKHLAKYLQFLNQNDTEYLRSVLFGFAPTVFGQSCKQYLS